MSRVRFKISLRDAELTVLGARDVKRDAEAWLALPVKRQQRSRSTELATELLDYKCCLLVTRQACRDARYIQALRDAKLADVPLHETSRMAVPLAPERVGATLRRAPASRVKYLETAMAILMGEIFCLLELVEARQTRYHHSSKGLKTFRAKTPEQWLGGPGALLSR
jgi:hypothetical protein